VIILAASLVATMGLSGCAMVNAPIVGALYTNVKGPVLATSQSTSPKTGTATCEAVIGIATGDCSLDAAMKEGGIKKVHYVDSKVKNVLGIYVEYTTIVHGE
jgi:hypothetical protein